MKLVRTVILVAALALAGTLGLAQDKAVGYDVGGCAPGSFLGAHIEVSADNITIISVSPGPDEVDKLDKPVVYKFEKKDDKGKHYINGDVDFLITKTDDEKIIGQMVDKDGVFAVVFGFPADGSKLAENAKKEFGICKDLLADPKPAADGVSKT
jgi:hypothetical protein